MGQRDTGDAYSIPKTLPYAAIRQQLAEALATSGYLPAEAKCPSIELHPAQVLFFTWGAHNKITPDDNPDADGTISGGGTNAPDDTKLRANLISRAQTIGGQKFAAEFAAAIAARLQRPGITDTDNEPSGSLRRLATLNDTNEALVHEIFNGSYYLIGTAYDTKDMEAFQRIKLPAMTPLWTTHISAAPQNRTLEEALPAMINAAANSLGRATPAK